MRASNTYRSRRRNDWRFAQEFATVPWRQWNITFYGAAGYGIPERIHPPSMARAHVARSKYMPHIGNKERTRYATPSNGRGEAE